MFNLKGTNLFNAEQSSRFLDMNKFNKMVFIYPFLANSTIGFYYGKSHQFPDFSVFMIAPLFFWAIYIASNNETLKKAAHYIFKQTPKKHKISRIIAIPLVSMGFLFFYKLSQSPDYVCGSYCLNSLSFQYSLSGNIFVFTGAFIFMLIFLHDDIKTDL